MSSDHKFKPTPERRGPAIYYDELGLMQLTIALWMLVIPGVMNITLFQLTRAWAVDWTQVGEDIDQVLKK